MDPLIGEIKMFPGSFAPQGWYTCEGQLLPINQYQALFAIIGTTYGGDGINSFKLPDLRGAFPTQCTNIGTVHPGGTYYFGQTGGSQGTTITSINVPPHTHTIVKGAGTNLTGSVSVTTTIVANNSTTNASSSPTAGNVLGQMTDSAGAGASPAIYNNQPATISIGGVTSTTVASTLNFNPAGLTVTPWGSGPVPVPVVPNFVAMQYIIAYEGVFPSRP
jgi:microcystin-dependent protein